MRFSVQFSCVLEVEAEESARELFEDRSRCSFGLKCSNLMKRGLMMFSELELNSLVELTLLVKASEKKVAKNLKPYLIMTLSDGFEDIQANMWDYRSETIPRPNDIVDIVAKVGAYMGKKQLTISDMHPNDSADPRDFLPKGNFDINEYYDKALELIAGIKDPHLNSLALNVYTKYKDLWLIAPSANGIHHAYVAGNLKHSVDTAHKAKALATHVPGCNIDLCTAGALLHDLGKLLTYEFDLVVIKMTETGQLMDHLVLGAQMLDQFITQDNADIVALVQHIILSHHGELEYGSPVTPRFIEALVVSYADGLDAKAATLMEESLKVPADARLTNKIWIFSNHPMFTRSYVDSVLRK